ncbi:transposase [Cohaesibacter sp. ES.047]|uniref:transposase n=1 Tax=Cohaesibacter sp. ES.047 TaxID=1798205 RepID=UPI000BB83314|nr:transposase [Cohaesibacter sp. ES.047]SNY90070.1 transposase [Cohaesibacter sp. ES.047]SNY92380.1 transposase [Cohaesibacter sp. ES.047]
MESTAEFLTPSRSARGRPRKWTDEEKAQIVSESLQPGARVRDVAALHGVRPNHLSAWRTQTRLGKLVLPEPEGAIEFASLIVEEPGSDLEPESGGPVTSHDRPEIECGSVIVRLEAGASAGRIVAVARSLARSS